MKRVFCPSRKIKDFFPNTFIRDPFKNANLHISITIFPLIRVFDNETMCLISDSEEASVYSIKPPKVIADSSEFQKAFSGADNSAFRVNNSTNNGS